MTGQDHPLLRDFTDFFENSLCGHAVLDGEGRFVLCNGLLARWLGYAADSLQGRRFSEFLSVGGRVFHETHLAPLLRMQGHFSEVALELIRQDGTRTPVFVNAMQRCDEDGQMIFTRLTVLQSVERQTYEANLRTARNIAESNLMDERQTAALREQFIAVLGHDLRNPLGAITMGAALLQESGLGPRDSRLVGVMQSSAKRMGELIENLMDFARFRLGSGVVLNRQQVDLDKVFQEVTDELRTSYPDRLIESEISVGQPVSCDSVRLSQILSNLLANALTHGAEGQPVQVICVRDEENLLLKVRNRGPAIAPGVIESLFQPFTREEARASQNGLGLGLYIASEVAKAHGGSLSASSTPECTEFVFRMPIQA